MKSLRRVEMGEEAWSEYQRLRKNNKAERYRLSHGLSVINWRRRAKLKLIEYKGGKCEICGYCKPCPRAYHFHHLDPSQKDFGIGGYGIPRSFDRLKIEVDKCQLLCSNCHSEIHDEEYKKDRDQGLEKCKKRMESLVKRKVVSCQNCSVEFSQDHGNQVYCSTRCSRHGSRKVERPPKEKLEGMIKEGSSWIELGREHGVSDSAVKKWAIAYGIEIPKRRSDRIQERSCLRCKNVYKPMYDEQQFCSDLCSKESRRSKRPTCEQMAEMLITMSYAQIGAKYGVKREATRRWASGYGLSHMRKRNFNKVLGQ